MFSIVILTYNEEKAIEDCLKSISWCNDIIVLDSFSTDNTCELAKQYGARIYKNEFQDFASQRNYALSNIEFKNEWVFHLDADEHFTDALKLECELLLKNYEHGAYLVPSKMIFLGKWIKYSSCYPVYQMRFHKIGDASFIQYGHGQRETNLSKGIGKTQNAYNHFAFEKGLTNWFIKHVKYAEDEAKNIMSDTSSLDMGDLLNRNSLKRRRFLKKFSYRIPLRNFFKFLYLYMFKLGFLDGKAGFIYCLMQSVYEQIIVIKLYELKQVTDGAEL